MPVIKLSCNKIISGLSLKAAGGGGTEPNSAKSSLSLTSNSLPGIDLDALAAMMQGGSSRGNFLMTPFPLCYKLQWGSQNRTLVNIQNHLITGQIEFRFLNGPTISFLEDLSKWL